MITLHITVGDRKQLSEEALRFVQDAEVDDRSDRDNKTVIQFGSYSDFVDSPRPLRLELIQAIAEGDPQSMREAARLVERDVSEVHSDLKHLETVEVIQFEDGDHSGAM
jgi:predicted transcriptional regulator